MKKWSPLVLTLILLALLTACKSPEEKRMAVMVDRLDSSWTSHEADLIKFFSSMEKMKSAVEPVQIYQKGEDSLLVGEAGEIWSILQGSSFGDARPGKQGKVRTEIPLVLGQNAWAMIHHDSLWEAHSRAFFRTWDNAPDLHFNHIYERLEKGEWAHLFYSESHISTDGEDRDDFLRMGLQVMPHLAECRYLLVSQPVLFAPGTWQGNSFDYGTAFNKVQVWDVESEAFIGHGWVKAVHSFSVFGISYSEENKAAARKQTLRDDLQQNLNKELRSNLGTMIENGKVNFPVWN